MNEWLPREWTTGELHLTAHAYIPRINTGGNFCGHHPASPVFALARPAKKGKGGLPRVLTLCMERLTNYYYRPRKVLPSLDLANGSKRQQRSERREGCVRLLSALLKRVDLTSLRVGIPTPDGFMNYTVSYIAEDTGMTLQRVVRALHDLKAANLITVAQPRHLLPDGSWKGLAAVKAVSKHLFGAFGLSCMLKRERNKASKRLKKKKQEWEQRGYNEPTTLTSRARSSLMMGDLTACASNTPRKRTRSRATDPPDDIEYRKKLTLMAVALKQANPDWDSAKCHAEAAKLL